MLRPDALLHSVAPSARQLPPVLVAALSALLLLTPGCRSVDAPEEGAWTRPDVLFILVDALRKDRLGLYGHRTKTSPYLDSVAAEGVVFESAWAHAPQTILSTGSLFTSMFFPEILTISKEESRALGVATPRTLFYLAPSQPTFLELAGAGGYRTVGFLTSPHHHAHSGYSSQFEEAIFLTNGRGAGGAYTKGSAVNQSVFDWLRQDEVCKRPFLAYVHYMDVHNPYRAPSRWTEQFVTVEGEDRYVNGTPRKAVSEADLLFMKQNYDAEVRYVDSLIANLHEAVRGRCSRELLLVVTSDHGDEFMEHGGLGHGKTLFKDQLAVPLIMHGGRHLKGIRYTPLVRQVDLGPTILDLAGLNPYPTWDGVSLVPHLEGRAGDPLVSIARRWRRMLSLTKDQWHYVLRPKTGRQYLFEAGGNLDSPDLAAEKPEIAEKLKRELAAYFRAWRESSRQAHQTKSFLLANGELQAPSDEILRQMEALGYVE